MKTKHTFTQTELQSVLDPGEGQEQAALLLFDVVTCTGITGLRVDWSVSVWESVKE